MHYIRFLKKPRLVFEKKKHLVKCLLTLENDLGEAIFCDDATLVGDLVLASSIQSVLKEKEVLWRAGMRSVAVELEVPTRYASSPIRMLFHEKSRPDDVRHVAGDILLMSILIPIASAVINPQVKAAGNDQVERPIQLQNKQVSIWEDVGTSIARHVWDAGISLVYLIDRTLQDTEHCPPYMEKLISASMANGKQINILELGAGCGLAGVAFAKLVRNSSVLITDVPEVEALVRRNITVNKPESGSFAGFQVLDWTEPLPPNVRQQKYDLVLVGDCIYNEDSIPALVMTMSAVAETSPQAIFVVATKTRHSSENVFFHLMASSGFVERSRMHVLAPMDYALDDLSNAERIDFYEFDHRSV